MNPEKEFLGGIIIIFTGIPLVFYFNVLIFKYNLQIWQGNFFLIPIFFGGGLMIHSLLIKEALEND